MSILAYRGTLPRIADNVFVAPGAWVIGDVVIGDRSSVWFNTVVRGDVNFIRIGSDTCVQDNCTLHVTRRKYPLQIGDRVVIGHKAMVHGCTIEDECMIGIGAIILDGAKVGAGSIIASGALLPPGFEAPPGSVLMGTPAKVKRSITDSDRELIRSSWSGYAELAAEYFAARKLEEDEMRGLSNKR